MIEIKLNEEEPLRIVKFEKHRIEFSNGAVITCDKGEFNIDIVEAILKAGEKREVHR